MRATLRIGRTVPVVVLTGALLAGCTSNPVGEVVRPSRSAPAPTPTIAIPTPTSPPPTQNAADATPVSVKCSKLVPTAVAQQLAALRGTACGWTDAGGDLLEVAVAKPSAKDATQLKNDLVRRSNSVPTYGGEAYFEVVDHIGRVDAFRGRIWISARSNRFLEPGDAINVVAAADAALGLTKRSTPAPTGSAASQPTPTSTP